MARRFFVTPLLVSSIALATVGASAYAGSTLETGIQLSYRGTVAKLDEQRNPGEPEKTFDLTLLVSRADEAGYELYWIVQELGRGAWSWPEVFGKVSLDADFQIHGPPGPSLLFERDEGSSVVALPMPFLAAEGTFAAGTKWTRNDLNYEVEGRDEIGDRPAWRVQVSNNFGRKRAIWAEDATAWLRGVDERVFMGKGEEYRLEMRLVTVETLPAGEFEQFATDFESLIQLRGKLQRPPRTEAKELSVRDLDLLAAELPGLEATLMSPSLLKPIKAARADYELQTSRAKDVAELIARFEGQPVDKFAVTGIDRAELKHEDLDGQVTVLHFWEYRDSPLSEPYGQVGYLDYLFSRRKPAGVRVYGVAVNGRLSDEAQRPGAIRSARKLKSFMNLGYPVLLDSGELIKQFGDPRRIGMKLPLWVVIGRDGKILHYRVGFYDVDRDAGLVELDRVVVDALK